MDLFGGCKKSDVARGFPSLAELVPIRYARTLANPFAFLRGSAVVMAADQAPGAVTGLGSALASKRFLFVDATSSTDVVLIGDFR